MQREEVKITPKRHEMVRNNLHLSNQELSRRTGLTEYEVFILRKVENDPALQPSGHRRASKIIERDPDKFTIREVASMTEWTRDKVRRDITSLDFIEKKKFDQTIWITEEDLERYKEYLEDDDDEN